MISTLRSCGDVKLGSRGGVTLPSQFWVKFLIQNFGRGDASRVICDINIVDMW